MLTYWVLLPLLLLRAAGASDNEAEPRSFNANSLQQIDGYPDRIRRYECPTGFFRLRRNCYYLSAGTASWRDAHFRCTIRNSTLAMPNKKVKDKMLRQYLMGEQFRRLERWIGGIYNWRKKTWEWGVSGEKMPFKNFDNPEEIDTKNFIHHCLVLDPKNEYKWNARACFEEKYFICEVPAGRIGKSRRRKNITDPNAPQNQRLRPMIKDRNKQIRINKLKKNWHRYEDNQIWVHGIKPGSRPPKSLKRQRLVNKDRRKSQRYSQKPDLKPEPRISQVTPGPGEFGPFLGGGRILTEEHLQNLGDNNELPFSGIFKPGSDFTREEILLKL